MTSKWYYSNNNPLNSTEYCKRLQNYNSMFAILGALSNAAVSRLKETWERVRGKALRRYQALEKLMDPTRNMARYRSLLDMQLRQGLSMPIIPLLPLVKKDLTFIQEANPSFEEAPTDPSSASASASGCVGASASATDIRTPPPSKLVNFEKMRMIAREIRKLVAMSSVPYVGFY